MAGLQNADLALRGRQAHRGRSDQSCGSQAENLCGPRGGDVFVRQNKNSVETRLAASLPQSKTGPPSLHNLLADTFPLREEVEIVWSAGFRIGAGHVEAAEGMRAYHRSRALAIQVEVAYVELAHGAIEFLARTGVDGAGQTELG